MQTLELIARTVVEIKDILQGRAPEVLRGRIQMVIYDNESVSAEAEKPIADEDSLFTGTIQNTGSASLDVVAIPWNAARTEVVTFPSGGRVRFSNFPLRSIKVNQAGNISVYGNTYTPPTKAEYASRLAAASSDISGLFSVSTGATPVRVENTPFTSRKVLDNQAITANGTLDVWTPASGKKVKLYEILVGASAEAVVKVQDNASTPNKFVILRFPSAGSVWHQWQRPLELDVNAVLRLLSDTAINVDAIAYGDEV